MLLVGGNQLLHADVSRPRPYQLEQLNATGIPPLLEGVETRAQWEQKRGEIMQAWLEYMGGLPPRPVPEVTVGEVVDAGDHIRQKISYLTAYDDQVIAYLLIPKEAIGSGKRFPAVLAMHPTNAIGKASVAIPGTRDRTYALELVQRGYVVLAPDSLTSGDRIYPEREHFDSTPFYEQHPEWSTVGKNLTDHLQAMDVLSAYPLVDPERIGVIGHSFGGYNTFFLASVDERVRVVASSCGISPFTNTKDPMHWGHRPFPYVHFPQNSADIKRGVVPFEFNEIIALTATRPQFFYVDQRDKYFQNWKAVMDVLADVKSLYAFLGQEDNFEYLMGSGTHSFPPRIREAAYSFIDAVLKPEN